MTSTSRRREIEANLEQRWLPRPLPADRVWVNVADERLVMYRDNRPIFSTRVIVGQDDRLKQTPELQTTIDAIWFNLPWNIPQDIAANELLPKVRSISLELRAELTEELFEPLAMDLVSLLDLIAALQVWRAGCANGRR